MSNRFINLEKNIHQIKLQQMGAHVEVIHGIMHFVSISIDDTIIKYVYHINDKGNYFLQRRSPYPINFGTYQSQDDIITIIKQDIDQMKNAKRSKKFNQFIEINKTLTRISKDFEDLYLDYNISHIQTQELTKRIEDLDAFILEIENISKKVSFE